MKKIIISGGGTGGHIFPAIAIADALKAADKSIEILFVGAEGKMEMERVPKAGYKIIGLPVTGFQRKISIKNLFFPFRLIASIRKAQRIIKDFQPDAVVGVGGYASGPILLASQWKNIPTLIQEQNSYAGVTNKILSQKANKICVSYPKMEKYFPKEKIIWTGNPVRNDLISGKKTKIEATNYFGFFENKFCILITGGSLGSLTLNESVAKNVDFLAKNQNILLIWQCGANYFEKYQYSEAAKLVNVKILPFLERIDLAYFAADIVICRAGALTISELCLLGKPAILVPSPHVAEDHQTKNAMSLTEKKAAILVKDSDAIKTVFVEAKKLLDTPKMMTELSENILELAKPNAANDIAFEIEKLIVK